MVAHLCCGQWMRLMRLHPLSQGLSSFLLVVLLCGLQRRGQQPSCYWKPIVSSLEQSQGLRRNIWIIGTIGSSAPFIGLFGTVVGIMRAFHSMAQAGAGGFACGMVRGGAVVSMPMLSLAVFPR